MTNDATQANEKALPSTFRATAMKRANQLASFIDKVMEPQVLQSPDERIEAAIEEIKLAYREKYPGAPIYVRDLDNIDDGGLIVLTNVRDQAPGSMHHERVGKGWRSRGGEKRGEAA